MKQFIPFILGLVLVSGHVYPPYPSEQVNSPHGPSTADCATCLARLDFLEDRMEDMVAGISETFLSNSLSYRW